MKKIILFLLVGALTFNLFGCKENTDSPDAVGITKAELDPGKIGYYSTLKLPLDDKNTEIKIFMSSAEPVDDSFLVIKELERRTGLNITISTTPTSLYQEKMRIMMAGSKGDLPDIVGGAQDINDLGPQGAFEPIEKHLKELPNLKEIFYDKVDEYETHNLMNSLRAMDGEIYTWPVWDIQRNVNHMMFYRKDIFDKHNIPLWDGPDGFYNTLKQLKALYPDSTPFTSKTKTNIFVDFGGMWNIRSVTTWTPYYDETAKVWKHCLTDPKMKEVLDFLKKLYDEELLDPEFLTHTDMSWSARMTQADKAFTTFDYIGRADQFSISAKEMVPGYDLRMAPPVGPEGKVRSLDKVWGNLGVVRSENSLLALQLLDYTISESGARLLTIGVEGVNYIDEGDRIVYTEFAENAPYADITKTYALFSQLANRYDKRSTYYAFTEREQEAQDMMLNKPGGGFFPFDPLLLFTPEEKAVKNEVDLNLQKAAEEFFTQYILTTATGDTAWSAWLEKAKGLGAEKVTEVYNKAQLRYDAK